MKVASMFWSSSSPSPSVKNSLTSSSSTILMGLLSSMMPLVSSMLSDPVKYIVLPFGL